MDIETTDRYPDCCEICEIAALKVVDWEVIDEFSRLVHIEGEMSGEASPRAFKRKQTFWSFLRRSPVRGESGLLENGRRRVRTSKSFRNRIFMNYWIGANDGISGK